MNSVDISVGNYCTCALLNLILLHISASYSFPLVVLKDTYLEVNLVSLILNQRCNIALLVETMRVKFIWCIHDPKVHKVDSSKKNKGLKYISK